MRSKGMNDSPGASHLIERQMLLSRVREQASPRRLESEPVGGCRFITITRETGALGDEVAAGLAMQLHWQVFDKEIVNFIAEDSRVRQDLVRELDERSQSLIHDMVGRLLLMAQGISFGNEEYHKALLKTLAYLAARGKALIIGRGGAFALQGAPGIHLRLIASPESRIKRLGQRWGVPPQEARRRMQQIDAERRGFIQHHFHQNRDALRFFDAIFNTDHVPVKAIVHAVAGMVTASEHAQAGTLVPGYEAASDKPRARAMNEAHGPI